MVPKPESIELTDTHKAVLAERGIGMDIAIAAGLRSASSREAKALLGFDPRSDGLLIPFVNPITGATRSYRFRPNVPLVIDNKPAKYLSPRGVGNLLYFAPGIKDALKDVATGILITEGELKTLSAVQHGFSCIGLVGVWGWRARGANGESACIADLDLLDLRGRVVNIVFDSDAALNAQVKKARHALAKELYRRGAGRVLALDLPAPDGVKVGLDDYLAANGREAFEDLDAEALPPTDIPPFSSPLSALLSAPEEPLAWGIVGFQPMGANGFRVAPPKTIKSWSMLEEAYSLATGRPLYGKFIVPERRRVLIIEEEDHKRRVRRRLDRVIAAHGGVVPSDEFFRISVKSGLRLDVDSWREVLEYEVRTFRPDFVYLDVFNRLHAKDVNDNQAMGEIVLFLDQLTRDHGTAFIILHHDRKNSAGGDPYNEILGSRALGGFSEATVFFAKSKERGVIKVAISLKDEPEDGSFEPEFQIRLADTPDGRGTGIEYLGPSESSKAESDLRAKVLAALDAVEWRSIKEVAEVVKVTKPTARECLNTLFDLKLVERDRNGQAYAYRKVPENFGSERV